jgi:hypothetical protein
MQHGPLNSIGTAGLLSERSRHGSASNCQQCETCEAAAWEIEPPQPFFPSSDLKIRHCYSLNSWQAKDRRTTLAAFAMIGRFAS